ncbi:MAG: EAL domain-containing protein [Actinomycetota bacterium]|nr:EAL domain-containing protein [Actinomycetota bacterium]
MARVDETPTVHATPRPRRRHGLRAYELLLSLPLLVFLGYSTWQTSDSFLDWRLLVWFGAIALVHLVPIPRRMPFPFSLSFPLELSVALLYPPPVAAVIVFGASIDKEELGHEHPPLTIVFRHAQLALCVLAQGTIFHSLTDLDDRWFVVGSVVILTALIGYAISTIVTAEWQTLRYRYRLDHVLRAMHQGVMVEFLLSYLGLALFSVLVAITTRTVGLWAIAVFIAPLAFAWQMLHRTHSLELATEELAHKQAENEYQALHDQLTDLPNRLLFQRSLAIRIKEAEQRGSRFGVMLMDLDHFKEINDALGHHFGDKLLAAIGPRIARSLRDGDFMARLGGDEFGVLLADLPDDETAAVVAERVVEGLRRPIRVEELDLDISGSVGVAVYPTHAEDLDTLLRHADVAMYAAKESGVGFEVYDEIIDRYKPELLTLVTQVRSAIEDGEFRMYLQPKVRLSDGRVAGAEALIRWEHPTLGRLSPADFIPMVEKTVLLKPLTYWAIEDVVRTLRSWADYGVRLPIAVNLSPRSLLDQNLPGLVGGLLERFDVPASLLRLELTESFLVADSGRSDAVLNELSRLGVGLSIDDFGTGFSSLSYLKRLPIEELKIERSFVSHMLDRAEDYTIVRATVELGRNLGLRVVAEGVQDRATFDRLGDFGCDEAQGFYIAKPLEPDAFWLWLSAREAEFHIEDEPKTSEEPATSGGPAPPRGAGGRLRAV